MESPKETTEEVKSQAKSFFEDMKKSTPAKAEIKKEEVILDESIPEEVKPIIEEEENPFNKPLPSLEPKAPKTKEDNIAALRKGRDEAVSNLKSFKDLFGEAGPELIKPVFEMIMETVGGPLTNDSVAEIITQFKESKKKIEDLELALAENDKMVTDIDVRYSSEFKEKFEKPYNEAINGLFADFANTSNGNVLAPSATKSFHEFLTSDPNLNHLQVKEALQVFIKSYKAEIGEDPLVPSMTSLMTSLRTFNTNRIKMKDAYDNWKEVKQKTLQESTLQQQELAESHKKSSKKTRVQFATKAWNSFNVSELEGVSTEQEIQDLFKDEFNTNEDLFEGKNVPTWDDHLKKGVSARLWEKHKAEFIELKQWKSEQEDQERNSLSGSSSVSKKAAESGKHWLKQ